MKTLLLKTLALGSIGLLMLSACKKDGAQVTSNGGKAGTLTASSTTLVLDHTMLSDTTKIINFSFTTANYGYRAAVTNTLEIDAAGDNWAKPTTVTLSTKVYKQGYSTADFNALLLKLNLAAGTASQVNVRVAHSISSTVTPVYSNVLSLTVTPFNLTSWIYAVGAFQGWNAGAPDSLISVTGNGIYTGIINFTAGNNQFLILPAKNYNNKYATTQTSTPSSTVAYNASNNLIAPATAGNYLVTFDSNAGTITFVPANSYSVIGDAAQGWSTDIAMKFVNDGNNNWVTTIPLVSSGAFKIRQNDDWTFSWGIPKASGDAGYGAANTLNDTSNNNITVTTSGTYTVAFGIPMTAVGTTPTVTASYTVTK